MTIKPQSKVPGNDGARPSGPWATIGTPVLLEWTQAEAEGLSQALRAGAVWPKHRKAARAALAEAFDVLNGATHDAAQLADLVDRLSRLRTPLTLLCLVFERRIGCVRRLAVLDERLLGRLWSADALANSIEGRIHKFISGLRELSRNEGRPMRHRELPDLELELPQG